jgi:hypothetical protein
LKPSFVSKRPQRGAALEEKLLAVQFISEDRLGMPGDIEIDAPVIDRVALLMLAEDSQAPRFFLV